MRGMNAQASAAASPINGPSSQTHRRSSNSMSSSSVVTIKRTASFSNSSSASGSRSSKVPMRPQSPSEASLLTLRVSNSQMPASAKPAPSLTRDAAEGTSGISEGVGNLNRWSHSTNSSVTSVGNTRRSRASSGAILPTFQTLSNQQLSPRRERSSKFGPSPTASPQRAAHGTSRRLLSPTPSPERKVRRGSQSDRLIAPMTALPPLHTTPALDPANDTESPSTIQTNTPSTTGLPTPSTQSSYAYDYFGENTSPRSNAKSKKPIMVRNNTAPVAPPHSRLHGSQESAHKVRNSTHLDSRPSTATETPAAENSAVESSHRKSRTRERGERDKKTMLSKALQKANTAVLLDNAQNFEGALEAYGDACRLLQQVMDRSSGQDDKRKLEAIKVTYTNRIEELHQLETVQPVASEEKTLPTRPMSDDSINLSPQDALSPISPISESAIVGTATMTRIVDVPKIKNPTRDSFLTTAIKEVEGPTNGGFLGPLWEQSKPQGDDAIKERIVRLDPPMEDAYMPPPLSPRRPLSPKREECGEEEVGASPTPAKQAKNARSRANSNASVSWLDTIDESGSSCGSSVHSVSSKSGLRRKHIRGSSGETDAEFHAAFDAAVEAAYDDGYEPDLQLKSLKASVAKQVAGPEDATLHTEGMKTPQSEPLAEKDVAPEMDDEEEERLLDEITSDYLTEGFDFDLQSKSALPRQSDSSGYSRDTWQSSQISDRTTAGTSLSTVAEDALGSRFSQKISAGPPSAASTVRTDQPPPAPPPKTALPRPPSTSGSRLSTVRSRRLSGQNLKQLKIETSSRSTSRKRASTFHQPSSAVQEDDKDRPELEKKPSFGASLEPSVSDVQHEHFLASPPSLELRPLPSAISNAPSSATIEKRRSAEESPGQLHSARPNIFRKNKSSVSLRDHTLLVSSPDESAPSLATPMSSTFMTFANRRNQDPLTAQRVPLAPAAFAADSQQSGGAYLFDTTINVAAAPTSPRSPTSNTLPTALEPCPESFLLRPFWLMRAIGSTLTHQRGGFITTRLFVPREVWQTRGVKLKNVDDKIANCDLLTAALGRLSGVDTYDADAVLEELQSFEEVMERVQPVLVKKLGSDVGVHGISGLFKDAATSAGGTMHSSTSDTTGGAEKAAKSKEGKSYLHSWRKLRSKSSGTPLNGPNVVGKGDREVPTMASVPMTSYVPVERRREKKDVRSLVFEGPNREYMGSLARLFEAAQVLDQIARQVEDPGLKHSSQTHVGLELSTRHAAEFFGFYICRFVLADLGTLVDKFVKRGTEWVLA